jgi:hypothetical protein
MGGIAMQVRVVYVDFDNFRQRIDEAKQCLIEFLPCLVRISSSRNGLHIKKICNNEIEHSCALSLKQKYDDPKRIAIDALRKKVGLTSEILFFVKCIGQERRVAGEWIEFESESDVRNMEEILK